MRARHDSSSSLVVLRFVEERLTELALTGTLLDAAARVPAAARPRAVAPEAAAGPVGLRVAVELRAACAHVAELALLAVVQCLLACAGADTTAGGAPGLKGPATPLGRAPLVPKEVAVGAQQRDLDVTRHAVRAEADAGAGGAPSEHPVGPRRTTAQILEARHPLHRRVGLVAEAPVAPRMLHHAVLAQSARRAAREQRGGEELHKGDLLRVPVRAVWAAREARRQRGARLRERRQLEQVRGRRVTGALKLEADDLGVLEAEGARARPRAADDGRRVQERRGGEVDAPRREAVGHVVPPRRRVGLAPLEQQDARAAVEGEGAGDRD
mmetsp:Transcript_2155/g.7687  ORF Transcript_2155/g.7687 Transcript_2155/m.7687 type:complete len:326 (-) Transcript_2155:1068-2045(-)